MAQTLKIIAKSATTNATPDPSLLAIRYETSVTINRLASLLDLCVIFSLPADPDKLTITNFVCQWRFNEKEVPLKLLEKLKEPVIEHAQKVAARFINNEPLGRSQIEFRTLTLEV